MAHDVFISHSTKNKPVADAVCATLERAAIRCWIAPRDLQPGRPFAGAITGAINRSKAMVLIFSADSNRSPKILRELQLATDARLHIIPFRIEDLAPNEDLAYYLAGCPHWFDATTAPLEQHLGRFAISLKEILGPPEKDTYPKLFINYRREDTAPYAGRLYDRLVTKFGEDQVFIDIDQIEPGEDFVEVINSKVGACDIAIVSIGPNWLGATDAAGKRRLDDSEDFGRMEIVAALERNIRVIPVLVGGARMPRKQDLPEALALLSRRNAIELSETRFHADVNRLIEAIAKVKEDPLKAAAAASKEAPYVNSLGMKFVPVAGTGLLFSVWETRVKDYAAFVKATGRKRTEPDFRQTEEHPAVNVSWDDAVAFCQWLTKQERKVGRIGVNQSYRLPSDLEWSAAVGLEDDSGDTPQARDSKVEGLYPWGTEWPPPDGAGNYGLALEVDRYEGTSPVGSFEANEKGIYDLGGNVWEWCEDWWNSDQKYRVLRGASWFNDLRGNLVSSFRDDRSPENRRGTLLSSYRDYAPPGRRYADYGFRCVLVVESSH